MISMEVGGEAGSEFEGVPSWGVLGNSAPHLGGAVFFVPSVLIIIHIHCSF